jgi:diguanylate cyclase (GGDEF)-like protein
MAKDLSLIIVDDMQFSRAVLCNELEKEGYQDIRLAASAREVLDLLQERNADVVIADWVMPEMNGLELTDAIRQLDEERSRYTSVIVFTAKEGDEAMTEAFERGVDDFITKPVNSKELAARVYAAGRISTLQNTLLETGTALAAAKAYLEGINTTDPMTGLGNQRFITHQLGTLLQQMHARGGGICLAMVDIDNFQAINNSYSYETGDEVLRAFARRLRRAVRPLDMVGRTTGDEFALLMTCPDTQEMQRDVFERINAYLQKRPIITEDTSVNITSSIGAFCFEVNDDPITVQEIVDHAHSLLKRAKEQGPNQIVVD